MITNSNDFIIETSHLCRSFGGVAALRDLSLSVPRGSVYGFLGRNGAGKTTAIKILAGLIRADGGEARVLGRDPFAFTLEDRRRVGYLSEKQILPPNFKTGKLIAFCAQFYPRWDHARVDDLVRRFRIDLGQKISNLSQGTQRQVAFILALAQKPELLILDEPASTLDVVARREFLDEILDVIRQEGGATVLLSSHILSDIERVADRVGILAEGELKIDEPLDELKETVKQIRFHSFTRDMAGFAWPGAYRTVVSRDEILVTARIADDAQPAQIARERGAQCEIIDLALEDIFVEISRSQES
ncbi:MAG TPA: ABC transporter ATP-binding protein [Chthoniobacteraceae bacterium]|nr:ABC transporter ATP-binding protein [Chthoniobacteraceae bacterium]